ncbi:cell division protein ZapA (FtsZ GTPase activity inhibitor) [Dysgonomonadaceae bacterium PH5-43]|nr:cell division protein ZapA (FtsZ GTPase activity inhibitor) [Dysgonomonadaceae bacterium PH5-43]
MDEKFKIQLKLADKYFPYVCRRSEEEVLRKAAASFNERILKYSTHYANEEFTLKDSLVLAGFQFSLEVLKKERKEDISPLFNRLEMLNGELEEYLNSFKK